MIVLYFVIKKYRDKIGLMNIKQDNNQKAYNSLLNQYVTKYSKNINRETIVFESNNVLSKVKDLYPALTKTDIAIIWLLYLKKGYEKDCTRTAPFLSGIRQHCTGIHWRWNTFLGQQR